MDENNTEDFYKSKVLELAKRLQERRLENRGIRTQETVPTYVIYARRSTKAPKNNQDKDKIDKQERSISDQVEACKLHALKNNLKVLAIETEEETAHKSNKRDVFTNIIDTIKTGKSYNSIIAWHPDRLARNMRDSGTIMDLLDSGVISDLQFPSFTFTNDASGKMALGIQFVLAKNYSDGLSVTTTRGIDGTVEDGKYTGKSKHGYTKDKDSYFRPDNDTFDKVQKIWLEAVNGKTARELEKISIQVGYPMKYKNILVMLHEPFYAGIYLHGAVTTDLEIVDTKFTPMVSYKDFITIDRNISDRKSFEHTSEVKNILFKKMVKCNHCGKFMTPYKSESGRGKFYYYISCSNPECITKTNKKLKRTVRGKVILNYMIEILENKLNVTKEVYEDAIKKYGETKSIQTEAIKQSRSTLYKQMSKLKENIDGLSRSLSKSTEKSEKSISKSINEKSEELNDKQEEYELLGEDLIKIESKITEEAMPYEKFSNFFKKAGGTIKSNRSSYLLDQLIRNIFLNFFIEDGKVIGHRLKEPFATYEILGSHVWGSIWKVIRNELFQYYLC